MGGLGSFAQAENYKVPFLCSFDSSAASGGVFFYGRILCPFSFGTIPSSGPGKGAWDGEGAFAFLLLVPDWQRPLGIPDGELKEPPAHLLGFGGDNAGHVRVLGNDDPATAVVLDHEALAHSALDDAVNKRYAFHKGDKV